MPSNIPWAVLPVVAWRRIPIYVSHHVDMFYYVYAYVKLRLLADFGYTMYKLISACALRMRARRGGEQHTRARRKPTRKAVGRHSLSFSLSLSHTRARLFSLVCASPRVVAAQ